MIATPPIVKPVSQMQLAAGSLATIPGVSWAEFEAILEELGESRSARVAYSQGILEIMVPLPEHEKPKELTSDLVKAMLRKLGQRYEPFGSTTFKRDGAAGVEPDACFYIKNYAQMIGRRRLQPGDPPPDLAIEMDVTSKTTLAAYAAIGVPELWIYDSGKLSINLFENGSYRLSETSRIFPDIPVKQWVVAAIAQSWRVGSVQALEEFEAKLASQSGND